MARFTCSMRQDRNRFFYSFCSQPNCVDGETPDAIFGKSRRDLFGTTYSGGTYSGGVAFKITYRDFATISLTEALCSKALSGVSTAWHKWSIQAVKAVVIGGAFGAVVTALVKDLITPLIAALVGKTGLWQSSSPSGMASLLIGDSTNARPPSSWWLPRLYFFVVVPAERGNWRACGAGRLRPDPIDWSSVRNA